MTGIEHAADHPAFTAIDTLLATVPGASSRAVKHQLRKSGIIYLGQLCFTPRMDLSHIFLNQPDFAAHLETWLERRNLPPIGLLVEEITTPSEQKNWAWAREQVNKHLANIQVLGGGEEAVSRMPPFLLPVDFLLAQRGITNGNRAANCMQDEKIIYLGEVSMSEHVATKRIPNMGVASYLLLQDTLIAHGLPLPGHIELDTNPGVPFYSAKDKVVYHFTNKAPLLPTDIEMRRAAFVDNFTAGVTSQFDVACKAANVEPVGKKQADFMAEMRRLAMKHAQKLI